MTPGQRQAERDASLLAPVLALIRQHRAACPAYDRIRQAIGHAPARQYRTLADLPWLPVRLFKQHQLSSSQAEPLTTLTSSGTTGRALSRIALDLPAAEHQRQLLIATLQGLIGPQRLPLLIIDAPSVVRQERATIRGATVLGLMQVGRDHVFALNTAQELDAPAVSGFLQRHGNAPFLIFGFTGQVWAQFYPYVAAHRPDLRQGLLLHTGGWKKLAALAVSPQIFRSSFAGAAGLTRCHNFYGMVEQAGTIHIESAAGDGLYCPPFADVIIRDPHTWQPTPVGTPGVIEVISTAPRAHPGNVLLTEDQGVIYGIDDGVWPGKRFGILGRLPRAEPRGCADTAPEAPQ